MKAKKIGKESKFLKALRGSKITRKQAASRFNLKNPSAAVLRFQQAGFKVVRTYAYNKSKKYTAVTYSIGGF